MAITTEKTFTTKNGMIYINLVEKRCREKKVEAILTEKKNVDPMICRKLQDVIAKPL
jgi:hypothetical protein